MNWSLIPSYGVRDLVGPLVKPLLAQAVMRQPHGWTTQAVIEYCAADKMQLWVAGEMGEPISAVCVTEIDQRPTAKALKVLYLAGDKMERWLDLIEHLERFAAAEDCDGVEVIGRYGWERKLADYGYSRRAIIVRKDIARPQ